MRREHLEQIGPFGRILTFLLIGLASLGLSTLVTGCGTSAKRNLSTAVENHRTVEVTTPMTFYVDNHKWSKKEADRVFDIWSIETHLKSNLTGKRLLSINPKSDRILLTYDFRLTAGEQQRVTLVVRDFTVTNKKRHKQVNSAYVNGKKYDFRH